MTEVQQIWLNTSTNTIASKGRTKWAGHQRYTQFHEAYNQAVTEDSYGLFESQLNMSFSSMGSLRPFSHHYAFVSDSNTTVGYLQIWLGGANAGAGRGDSQLCSLGWCMHARLNIPFTMLMFNISSDNIRSTCHSNIVDPTQQTKLASTMKGQSSEGLVGPVIRCCNWLLLCTTRHRDTDLLGRCWVVDDWKINRRVGPSKT